MAEGFGSAGLTDRVKPARLCGDGKGPSHRDADNPFIENEQSIASSDNLIGLHGVIGIARLGERMDPPGAEGEALAIGQHVRPPSEKARCAASGKAAVRFRWSGPDEAGKNAPVLLGRVIRSALATASTTKPAS